jgi:uncharacterized phage-associated protein
MTMAAPKIDSVDLAKFILAKAGPMPHLKLQKLVYYVEAWHLAIFKESIIEDKFKAWMHGPVSTKVWHAFKDAKAPVFCEIKISPALSRQALSHAQSILRPEQISLINDVLKEYGSLNAYELESLTHSEKPWIEARRGVPPDEASSNEISKDTMLKFYRQRLYGNAKGK